MKFVLILISFLFLAEASMSQSVDECKYLSALTYLRTNANINERIKGLFSRIKIINKKDRFVEFNLSNRVDYLSIYDFKETLNSKDFGISKELINDNKLFYTKYFFESFRSEFLKKIIDSNESKLFLTFSKPFDNYLLAIIGNSNPDLTGTFRMGLGMTILFRFNSSGLVEDVLCSAAAFN